MRTIQNISYQDQVICLQLKYWGIENMIIQNRIMKYYARLALKNEALIGRELSYSNDLLRQSVD